MALLRSVQGCRFGVDGVTAVILQDGISMGSARCPGGEQQPELRTAPETLKEARRR